MRIDRVPRLFYLKCFMASSSTNASNLFARWASSGVVDLGYSGLNSMRIQEVCRAYSIDVVPTTSSKDGATTIWVTKNGVRTILSIGFQAGAAVGVHGYTTLTDGPQFNVNDDIGINIDTSASLAGSWGCIVIVGMRPI